MKTRKYLCQRQQTSAQCFRSSRRLLLLFMKLRISSCSSGIPRTVSQGVGTGLVLLSTSLFLSLLCFVVSMVDCEIVRRKGWGKDVRDARSKHQNDIYNGRNTCTLRGHTSLIIFFNSFNVRERDKQTKRQSRQRNYLLFISVHCIDPRNTFFWGWSKLFRQPLFQLY